MIDKAREHASLSIDGRSFEVVALRGREAVSTLFTYDITCRGAVLGPAPDELVGALATIELYDGFGTSRRVHGLVTTAEHRAFDDDNAIYSLTVRPAAFPLTLGRNCRVFQDQTVPEIVAAVLAAAPPLSASLTTQWELASTYPKRTYTAQYREDDWTFCARLLEEEGIYYWFDHGDDGSTLVFADDSTRAPELAGGAHLEAVHEAGTTRDRESVLELGAAVSVRPGKFSVGSFNPANPGLAVSGAAGEGDLEIYQAAGGGPGSPEACARRARIAQQGAAASGKGACGTALSVRLVPGRIAEISGHTVGRLDGRYLVLESSVSVTQRRRGAAGASPDDHAFACKFRAVPADLAFRPPRLAPEAKQAGLQIGVVVGPGGAEVHTDASGRVRVQFHWDREGQKDDKSGKWMRVAQRPNDGSMLYPRMGWNVAALHEEGNVDAPNVLSRFTDGNNPPSYGLPENKTRLVYKTQETPGGSKHNEIRFESKSGSEEMFLNASKDMEYLVKRDRTEKVQRDASRKIGRDHTFEVEGKYEDDVRRDQKVEIGKDEQIQVEGTYEKVVDADEIVTIAGKRSLKVDAKFTDQVSATRDLRVGSAQIDTTLGLIASTAKETKISVGGAIIRATAHAMTETVKGKGDQKIGAARVELVKTDRVLSVEKNLFETVGGAMISKSGGLYKVSSKYASMWNVAFATKATAPDVVIEAENVLYVMVGGSSIAITPDSVTITTPAFDLSKAKAVVSTTTAEHHN